MQFEKRYKTVPAAAVEKTIESFFVSNKMGVVRRLASLFYWSEEAPDFGPLKLEESPPKEGEHRACTTGVSGGNTQKLAHAKCTSAVRLNLPR